MDKGGDRVKKIYASQVIFEDGNKVYVFENGHGRVYKKNEVEIIEPNWKEIEKKWAEILKVLHENLGWFNTEELENTPRRITGVIKEWYDYAVYKKWTVFENGGVRGTVFKYDQLVVLKDIRVFSKCSHHYETIDMKVSIAYLPGESVIGLSKLARAARKFASKPQIQEQFTEELATFLWDILKPRFLMVWVEGIHYCVVSRGVRAEDAIMVTSAVKYDKNDSEMVKNWKSLKEEAMAAFGVI